MMPIFFLVISQLCFNTRLLEPEATYYALYYIKAWPLLKW